MANQRGGGPAHFEAQTAGLSWAGVIGSIQRVVSLSVESGESDYIGESDGGMAAAVV